MGFEVFRDYLRAWYPARGTFLFRLQRGVGRLSGDDWRLSPVGLVVEPRAHRY